jgi:hypothetical protein
MPTITETSTWQKSLASGKPIGVDREKRAILGYVVAQEGPFKTQGRGEFNKKSLQMIAELMTAEKLGLKCRFTHPTLSADGLGKFLGRSINPRLDTITKDGKQIGVVRADLYFDESASKTPNGDLADYVMTLAESDPDALSSSLVIEPEEIYREDTKGQPLRDSEGSLLPPLWYPVSLHASDIVDTGEAVDGLLSANLSVDGLPDEVVRQAAQLLASQFAGQKRAVVRARALAFLDKALLMFGDDDSDVEPVPQASLSEGDRVQFMWAHPSGDKAVPVTGTVRGVANHDKESVGIPGTALSKCGPAAMVESDDGAMHLSHMAALTKIVEPDAADPISYMASDEDERERLRLKRKRGAV